MDVVNTVNQSQFSIECKFNLTIINWIKKQEKRFWDYQNKKWFLPLIKLSDFEEFLESNNITYVTNQLVLIASITKDASEEKWFCKLNMFTDRFSCIVKIPGIEYLRDASLFQMTQEGLVSIMKYFDDNDIIYKLL